MPGPEIAGAGGDGLKSEQEEIKNESERKAKSAAVGVSRPNRISPIIGRSGTRRGFLPGSRTQYGGCASAPATLRRRAESRDAHPARADREAAWEYLAARPRGRGPRGTVRD